MVIFLHFDALATKARKERLCINSNLSFSRSLLNQFKEQLGLDSGRVPGNTNLSQFAEALAKAWKEYNNPRLDLSELGSLFLF